MTTSRIRARRLAAAAVGSSLLFLSFSATTAHAIDNKGVVKVQQPGAATVTPDNNPTIKGCSVQVELRGFGGIAEGGEDVTIHFAHQGGEWNGNTADFSPTTGIRVTENKSGTDLNATQTYVIKPVQGVTKQSLKVTAKSAGQDLNSKVFTITDCEQADDTVTDPEPTLNPVVDPSVAPSTDPSGDPSTEPSVQPSADPSADPS
ncbi:MAG: hypothetical protein Q4G46_10875, partial [Propionibacteriaceae bacterium]|nr:hypothetical protein [Propionibacteriaceae bacterium]